MRIAALALALVLITEPAAAQWRLVDRQHVLTEDARVALCNLDSRSSEICFWFAASRTEKGVVEYWASVRLPKGHTGVFDRKRDPWLQIDNHGVHDDSSLFILGHDLFPRRIEARWIAWRVTVWESSDGEIVDNWFSVLWQTANGQQLRIKIFLEGGLDQDSTLSLGGFGALLRQNSPLKIGDRCQDGAPC